VTALLSELQYAVRRLTMRPRFSAVVVLSLALGIGANAVIYSLASALLHGATPYPHPDRVAVVWFTPPHNLRARILATDANCAALRDRARSFDHLGCVLPDRSTTVADIAGDHAGGAGAVRAAGQEFTAGVAEALGAAPALGRWFTFEEEERAEPVMVISNRLWRRQFGSASDIVGRRVRATNQGLKSEIVTIVGVAPEGFQFLDARSDYWLPFSVRHAGQPGARRLLVVGRLKHGVTLRQARSELNAIAAALGGETPSTNRGWGILVEPVRETLQSGLGRPLLVLQGAVGLVLLIACGNVAGLLLADGITRRGEMAVRSALGASRWRIVRSWLVESALASMVGAALGLAFAWAGLRVLAASLPAEIPGVNTLTLHVGVVAFTAVVSVLAALLCGIAPALQALRAGPAESLKRSGRPATSAGSGDRLRGAFVVGQIAFAVVLTVGAGLMIHSLLRLRAVDVGIDTGKLMTFQVRFDGRDYIRDTAGRTPSGAVQTELQPRLFMAGERIQERLAHLPGVQGVTAMAATPPLSGFARTYTFVVPGAETSGTDRPPAATEWFPVLPDYFKTLGVPILRGRDFNASDTAAGLPVVVVNTSMAEELWPGEDPIGRQLQLRLFNEPPRQVVGVVSDLRQRLRPDGPQRQTYVPFAQLQPMQSGVVAHGLERLTFVVRVSGAAAPLGEAFRGVVGAVDPDTPVVAIQPLQRYVEGQLGDFMPYVLLLGVFGAVAVVLAVVGTYGLVAHAVSLRVQEIGIRLALGATPRQALGLILRRGIVLSAAGLLLGLAGALVLTKLLESFLWEVTPTDPATYGVVAIALAAASTAASYSGARRALAIEPAAALSQS
jgi:putative ABC transport system permease protein